MFKQLIFTVIFLTLLLGATPSSALAGPPWPAEVIPTDDPCFMFWIAWNGDIPTWIMIPGTGNWVYQPQNGHWNTMCHLTIDFSDPSIATIEEMCALYPDFFTCHHGEFQFRGWLCGGYYGLTTDDSIYTVNPHGIAIAVCHFNPVNP